MIRRAVVPVVIGWVVIGWVVACCAALAIGTARAAVAAEITGDYSLAGQTATGTYYQGGMAVVANGRTFRVNWNRPAPLAQHGYALQLGNVLGVVAADPNRDYGIVMYRVKDGLLEGIWRGDNGRWARALGRETLIGPKGLDGRYEIALGKNGDGSSYDGYVEIKKSGPIYLVDWFTPGPSYVGTGVLVNDILVVAFGSAKRHAVTAYCLGAEPVIEGVTGLPGDSVVGAEIIWPSGMTEVDHSARRLAEIRSRGRPGCGTPIGSLVAPPESQTVTSR